MTSSFFSTLPRILKKVKRQWKYELIPSTLRCYLDVQNEELVLHVAVFGHLKLNKP